MNSYEVFMLFSTEEEASNILSCYESKFDSNVFCLETILPTLFQMEQKYQSENFYVEGFKRVTNEILMSGYGTKFPSLEIQTLFTDLGLNSEHGIKLKYFYDDGEHELYHIVNGVKCSAQKFSAFYRKVKIKDSADEENGRTLKKNSKATPVDLCKKFKQEDLIRRMDYGKDKRYRTALIRLHIKKTEDRDKAHQFFQKYINIKCNEDLIEFSYFFNELLSQKSKKVSWSGKDPFENDSEWLAPDKFMTGLKFVITDDEYVYLGFDTEPLTIHSPDEIYRAINCLLNIFGSIKFVKKCWVKYRSGKNPHKEWIIRQSAFGSSEHRLRNTTEDYKW